MLRKTDACRSDVLAKQAPGYSTPGHSSHATPSTQNVPSTVKSRGRGHLSTQRDAVQIACAASALEARFTSVMPLLLWRRDRAGLRQRLARLGRQPAEADGLAVHRERLDEPAVATVAPRR